MSHHGFGSGSINDDNEVTIRRDTYERLQEDRKKLIALENAGVDNWEWYDEAMSGLD